MLPLSLRKEAVVRVSFHVPTQSVGAGFSGEIVMKRYLGWALLVAAGLLLGVASSSYQRHQRRSARRPAADADNVRTPTPSPN